MAGFQARLSSSVQGAFFNGFYTWGLFVGRKPKTVIGVSFFLAVCCSARLIMAPSNPLPSESRQEKLFSPQDSQVLGSVAAPPIVLQMLLRGTLLGV